MTANIYNPMGWFEIPTADIARAQKFYETVLAVSLTDMAAMPGHTMRVFPFDDRPDVSGAAGAIIQGERYQPAQNAGAVIYFATDDIDVRLTRARAAGGSVRVEKTSVREAGGEEMADAGGGDGSGGHFALIEDLDANTVGFFQPPVPADANAPQNMVGWFELPATDIARAQAFYEHLFGITMSAMHYGGVQARSFPMHERAIGASGVLCAGDGYQPAPAGSGLKLYFTAPDITAHLQRAQEKGGTVLAEKFSIGEHGFVGMLADPDGNVIGLHERATP